MARQDTTEGAAPARRRLPRAQRRDQIVAAATTAFVAKGGYATTSLDDIAQAAEVSRAILYRHFESKTDLYHAVVERAAHQLRDATTDDGAVSDTALRGLVNWARADPDAFELLFRHAVREPKSAADVDELRAAMSAAIHGELGAGRADVGWDSWKARLHVGMVIEALLAWLDAGRPDPQHAEERILDAVHGAFRAIRDA